MRRLVTGIALKANVGMNIQLETSIVLKYNNLATEVTENTEEYQYKLCGLERWS
jgi:hypothetical protein